MINHQRMESLTRPAYIELLTQGFRYALILDFIVSGEMTTLVIQPLRHPSEGNAGLHSITSLTDAMITAPLDSDSGTVAIRVVKENKSHD